MANLALWNTLSAVTHLLTTELNSIANGKVCAASAAFDNRAGPIDVGFAFHLASLTPAAGGFVVLWGWMSLDASVYGGPIPGSGAAPSLATPALKVPWNLDSSGAGVQDIIVGPYTLFGGLYKFQIENESGVSFAGSGNTLDIYTAKINLNG